MNLDPTWLFLSLFTGAVGMALFLYGKKEQRWPQIVFGLLYMVYPYFTPNVSSLVIVGVILGGVLWYLIRRGQ